MAQLTTCRYCGSPSNGNYCVACGAPVASSVTWIRPPQRPLSLAGKHRRSTVIITILALLFTLVLLLLAYTADAGWGLALSIIAAFIPAIVYARLILSFDRYEPEPRRAVITAFLWGGGGAVIFSVIAELLFAKGLRTAIGEEGATVLGVIVGAPVIEEAMKGIALLAFLWFYRSEFDGTIDGLVYGALVGLGFSVVENVGYFLVAYSEDGADGLGELFIARVLVNGLGHAVYTGVIGAAIGWSRTQYSRGFKRILIPFLGFLLGVFLHFCWNFGVSLIAVAFGEDASLLQVVLVGALFLVLPTILIFASIARRASKQELAIIRRQLAPEVAYGVIQPSEYLRLGTRVKWMDRFLPFRSGTQTEQRFAQIAGELAFRKEHLSRGEPPTAGELERINYYRAQLAYLRQMQQAAGVPPLTT